MKVTKLTFDSDLSGHIVGKCMVDSLPHACDNYVVAEFKKYDLIYLTTKFGAMSAVFLAQFDWCLADVKITLSQTAAALQFINVDLGQDDFYEPKDSNRIITLALDLYRNSRFYFDVNTRGLGKKIYERWIRNAMNKSVVDEIIVHRHINGRLIGFVAVKLNKTLAEPTLVKVDPSLTRRGYGRVLMNKFISLVLRVNPDSRIQVRTQLRNLSAIGFYQSFGLKLIDYDFVYHVYPKGFQVLGCE